ncbi:MAG: hypothetical protein JXM69_20010 [Anaerolineae bacterium]|nr:hypothetical protein [Anaerolineae bacterium]
MLYGLTVEEIRIVEGIDKFAPGKRLICPWQTGRFPPANDSFAYGKIWIIRYQPAHVVTL